jgi:hypothetical protein
MSPWIPLLVFELLKECSSRCLSWKKVAVTCFKVMSHPFAWKDQENPWNVLAKINDERFECDVIPTKARRTADVILPGTWRYCLFLFYFTALSQLHKLYEREDRCESLKIEKGTIMAYSIIDFDRLGVCLTFSVRIAELSIGNRSRGLQDSKWTTITIPAIRRDWIRLWRFITRNW